MNFKKIAFLVLPTVAVLLTIWTLWPRFSTPPNAQTSDLPFDYYVLSLSWSPTYCQSDKGRGNKMQCGTSKRFGFIVHGLWPQFEHNGWPEFCTTPHRLSASLINNMLDLMPSKSLIRHQWDKHGSCSGLTPEEFFAQIRTARVSLKMPYPTSNSNSKINISPGEIASQFRVKNPSLAANSLIITCDNKRLKEVRICLDKNLNPRQCSASTGGSCRKNSIRMPLIR